MMTSSSEPDLPPQHNLEAGKVEVKFLPGCLVLSIVLSIVGTILLNVLIRLLN